MSRNLCKVSTKVIHGVNYILYNKRKTFFLEYEASITSLAQEERNNMKITFYTKSKKKHKLLNLSMI